LLRLSQPASKKPQIGMAAILPANVLCRIVITKVKK
jgi:hypothetical protein